MARKKIEDKNNIITEQRNKLELTGKAINYTETHMAELVQLNKVRRVKKVEGIEMECIQR